MGLFDLFKKKAVSLKQPFTAPKGENPELTYADKERILVERMTKEDMRQFTAMPYDLNCPLHKSNKPGTHAFAYMDLNPKNIRVAKVELEKLNIVIDCAREKIPLIPKWARINVDKIAFHNYSEDYGYTRLICLPHTYSGKIERFPLKLLFVSFLSADSIGIQVNGDIKYSVDGRIAHATVNCWNRSSQESSADGWQYIFYDNDGDLTMREILSTIRPDEYGRPTSIYKCPELLEEDRQKEKDKQTLQWLQENLPFIAPKSLSGFRRMRSTNSKNYQKIVEEAAKLGKNL